MADRRLTRANEEPAGEVTWVELGAMIRELVAELIDEACTTSQSVDVTLLLSGGPLTIESDFICQGLPDEHRRWRIKGGLPGHDDVSRN